VFRIRTAILLSSVIVAVLVALAHAIPAAASRAEPVPYEMVP
jgi:hypothetical protein